MKSIAILGTAGHVPDPGRFEFETILTSILGANSGNLMFQYAAARLVGDGARHLGLANIPYMEPTALAGADMLVFPAANHLRLGCDWTGLCNFIEKSKLPLIVLGLGAQAASLDDEADMIEALRADEQVGKLVRLIAERAVFVSVRGAFSARVCKALGLQETFVLGCPSLLINDAPDLGKQIADKLLALRDRNTAVRFGITAAAPFEIRLDPLKSTIERRLISFAQATDALYFQQSGGLHTALFAAGRRDEVPANVQASLAAILAPDTPPTQFYDYMDRCARFHLSANDWMTEAATLDLVIGTRLHGNMAAIGAGTPGIVIAHDTRTSELQDLMQLPHVSAQHVINAPDLNTLLAGVTFDPEAFDAHRTVARRVIKEAFDRLLH